MLRESENMEETYHQVLNCGIELVGAHLPTRRAVTMEIRFLAGTSDEPADQLGVAHLIGETVDKGTEKRGGRELLDAFDVLGASHGSWVGRECSGYHLLCLPEFFDQTVSLHAEFLRTPTFQDQACRVAVELACQEITALDDDPHALLDKLLGMKSYGQLLGRHSLGERETLERIGPDQIRKQWEKTYHAGRMLVSVAGPLEPQVVAQSLERWFEGFGSPQRSGRGPKQIEFAEGNWHYPKDAQQQHLGICYAGVPMGHEDYPIEQVIIGLLAGGMSARLFTEVREKQGLVYWVSAWHEHPRGSGMIFLGASTTPARCDKTYSTLLRELERLGEDLVDDELARAKAGILVRSEMSADVTRSRCGELIDDLFHFGHPLPRQEKIDRVQAVTIEDVKRYLAAHPRAPRCVVTLGPCEMGKAATEN
ncbi:MAG: insulinase family protein [Phycisphaerae bacterium]|nr:insulinase family protein [Phycisphaerae bacterium]